MSVLIYRLNKALGAPFQEQQHPRAAKGSRGQYSGGRFAPKGMGGSPGGDAAQSFPHQPASLMPSARDRAASAVDAVEGSTAALHLPQLSHAIGMRDLLNGTSNGYAAVADASVHLLKEHVEKNRHLGLSWGQVKGAAKHLAGEIREKMDIRETARSLKDLGKKHGPAFLAYAIAIEAFEDIVMPAVLTAIGKPYLIPFALAFHTEPVMYPLYFGIAKLMNKRRLTRQQFAKAMQEWDARFGVLRKVMGGTFQEQQHPRAPTGSRGQYSGGRFAPRGMGGSPGVPAGQGVAMPPPRSAASLRAKAQAAVSQVERSGAGTQPPQPAAAVAPAQGALFHPEELHNLPEKAVQSLAEPSGLYAQAHEANDEFQRILNRGVGLSKTMGYRTHDVATQGQVPDEELAKPGGMVVLGPIKTKESAERKVRDKYNGHWEHVKDLYRASVAVDTMAEMHQVMDHLRKSGMQLAAQPDDKFANPTPEHYRDVSMNVRMSNGHIGELQLHLKPIMRAKGPAHKLYEVIREIDGKEKRGEKLTADEIENRAKAREDSIKLYDAAFAKAMGRPVEGEPMGKSQPPPKGGSYYDVDGMPVWETTGDLRDPKRRMMAFQHGAWEPYHDNAALGHQGVPIDRAKAMRLADHLR